MNIKEIMIIIDGKISTSQILKYKYIESKELYSITYKNTSKTYLYSQDRIKILTNSKEVNLKDYIFIKNEKIINDINKVFEFIDYNESYFYIIYNNKTSQYFNSREIIKQYNNSKQILEYMKKVADEISLTTTDGKKILRRHINNIEPILIDTCLGNYFQLSNKIEKKDSQDLLIFPFGCNTSQYQAVKNALFNRISIIEGPPGTGKTQTILNIIANLIIRNKNCQVVSNNNTAIQNIEEKLKKYNLEFLDAILGKMENKKNFIENQKLDISFLDKYKNFNLEDLKNQIKRYYYIVEEIYKYLREIALLKKQKNDYLLEYKYFINQQKDKVIPLYRFNLEKIDTIWNELLFKNKPNIFQKLKYILLYKTGNYSFYKNDIDIIIYSLQYLSYKNKIELLEKSINEKEAFIEKNSEYEQKYINLSMLYLRTYLANNYAIKREKYNEKQLWLNPSIFIKDYPIVLSTTYSSKSTFINDFKFDYIIMDESSQIDVVTGTLALSSAKNGVIIGDEKQLQNVIPDFIKGTTANIFKNFNLNIGYSYELNSFLSSVKKVVSEAPVTLLREHYRCHPKIINFCNQKFYNNELIIMTEDNNEENVIKVIKTVKGNHAREKSNQRQVDIIKELLNNNQTNDIGIIAPFNNQVSLIKKNFPNVETATIHKFQGREKDKIIISTVENDISDFTSNSNILNVAISRAKKELVLIITGNEINNKNINDFIDYVNYNNMEITTSNISSVFDKLYKCNEQERINFYKKAKRISKYDSENFIYDLLKRILKDYDSLDFIFTQKLSQIIKDNSLLDENEKRYISHYNTHIDFLIFKKIGNIPILAIEVDGYKHHKFGTKQYKRDELKDSILDKYNIPLKRLKTNGSEEEYIIREKLKELLK